MAKSGPREKIRLKSTESDYSYYTHKNKRNTPDKLKRKKFDPKVGRHVEFVESKIAK